MLSFSANLGFLFTDRPLPDAVRAAKAAGFAAVECHWPFETPPGTLKALCEDLGMPLLGLNTWPGDRAAGEFGLAALPGREDDARAEIDRAIAYAGASGTRAVHVMAGVGGDLEVFAKALDYAASLARPQGITILIEPLNDRDVPGYMVTTTAQAARLQDRVGAGNLKIMFDCYHLQIMEGGLERLYRSLADRIGHVQFAAVPDRGEPDAGEVDYRRLLPAIRDAGYDGHFGAEYRPRTGRTEDGLGWLKDFTPL